jgi:hypothetical protein
MSSEEPKLIAILRRNLEGEFEKSDGAVYLREDDEVALLPVTGGLVAIIGPIYEDDEPAIDHLLENL